MIMLLLVALLVRRHRARRPVALAPDGESYCVTGGPCTMGCSLFCALEGEVLEP